MKALIRTALAVALIGWTGLVTAAVFLLLSSLSAMPQEGLAWLRYSLVSLAAVVTWFAAWWTGLIGMLLWTLHNEPGPEEPPSSKPIDFIIPGPNG